MTEAEQLRDEGMQASASKYAEDLAKAQRIAVLWGMGGKVCTSDDIRDLFLEAEGRELAIGNAIGSLFKGGIWEYVGRKKSVRKSSHARWLSCWKLRETYEEFV